MLNEYSFKEATMDMLRSSIHDDAKFCHDFMTVNADEFETESIVEIIAVQHEIQDELSDCLLRVNNRKCGIDEMIMIYTKNAKKMKELRIEIMELFEEAKANKKVLEEAKEN